jgi:HlyD family secretion protein
VFTVDAYPDRTFEGTVTKIRNTAVTVQDVVTYGAEVEVKNPDLALRPGMTAAVRIRTAAASGVLRVPGAALRFVPPGEEPAATPGVRLVEGDTLRRVQVQPGISDGELTAIADGAVSEGANVILDLTPEGRRVYGIGR